MTRPKILDLFCGAGGAGVGYHRAGFDVVGVDIEPRDNYPLDFVCADAIAYVLTVNLGTFDAIHASPPCQLHSTLRTGVTGDYEDLVADTRWALERAGKPYVIENVPGAPLHNTVTLCGTAHGCVDDTAELHRHRLFETNWTVWPGPPPCDHRRDRQCLGVYGDLAANDRPSTRGVKAGRGRAFRLMGVDWPMTDRELAEAIPPAYTEWIGARLIEHLQRTKENP